MRLLHWTWRIAVGGLAALGLVVVLAAIGGAVAWTIWRPGTVAVPERAVVVLDLGQPLAEAPASPLDLLLGRGGRTLRATLDGIDRAAADERVAGLLLALGGGAPGSLAQAQELRDALSRLRARGKFVVAFGQGFDESGGLSGYLLASEADEIWLQPSGLVGMSGAAFEAPFAKRALGRIGVVADISRRKDFKSGADMLTEDAMTAANREQLQALATAWAGQAATSIAARRGTTAASVRALMDRAPLLADEALAARLVDRLGYRDEAQDAARSRAGAGAKTIAFGRYLAAPAPEAEPAARIALIHAVGPIVPGRSERAPTTRERVVAADRLAAAIESAAASKRIAAIILRIDSPGGSYAASDAIWHAVSQARRKGKPVIASMGRVAASGGYFVAMAADKIVAQPATITGSIGVFAGKVVLADLWRQIDVDWGLVKEGDAAAMWSQNRPFSTAERARLDRFLDRVYDDFTAKAAAGRGMSREAMERAAQGRIWSGADALSLRLVDALGGLDVAQQLARAALKLPEDAAVAMVDWPRPRSPTSQAIDLIAGGSQDEPAGIDALGAAADDIAAIADAAALLQPLLRPLAAMAEGLETSGPGGDGALLARPPSQAPQR
ncbi:MAG: signal peptide peptidase SppA [Alphaproteobacteria bacterium]|nr:signal peptide peptidase SppA [Alphaproteobacteria bacterium]